MLTANSRTSRRAFLLAGLAVGPLAGAFAQGQCSASGMTLDEALAAWQDAQRKAQMDSSAFNIMISRTSRALYKGKKLDGTEVEAMGVLGTLSVNGVPLGDVLENEAVRIKAGTYKGVMRYFSKKNFVQGPFGVMGEIGDFLLEVSGVQGRSALLLHTGTKPWHSEGCILAGAAKKVQTGGQNRVTIETDSTLRALRKAFYGSDAPPNACPNKTIVFTINDI